MKIELGQSSEQKARTHLKILQFNDALLQLDFPLLDNNKVVLTDKQKHEETWENREYNTTEVVQERLLDSDNRNFEFAQMVLGISCYRGGTGEND